MSKIEKCIPKFPNIYRVFEVADCGKETPSNTFRVRKRVKVLGRWTTRVATFDNFEAAKVYVRQPLTPEVLERPTLLTFREVFEKFLHYKEFEENRAPGTIHGYRSRAQHFRFFENMEVRDITPMAISIWADLLLNPEYKAKQQSSRESYDHELVLLTGVLNYYREFHDETYLFPIMKKHRKRLCPPKKSRDEIRYLSTEEEMRFLDALKRWPVIHDLALFQLHTGARVGEAAALTFDAVEFMQRQVRIRQHLHWDRRKNGLTTVLKGTKTRMDRTIPLTPECLEMLRMRLQKGGDGRVFEDPKRGSWFAYRSIQSVYDDVFKRLGLPHRGTHTLRHTFAVRFLEQTENIHALQRALGHTDLEVTQVYAKYSDASVKRVFEVFRGGGTQNPRGRSNFVPKVLA